MSEQNKNKLIRSSTAEFLIYQTLAGDVRVDCLLQNETIWLAQKNIASLFGVQRPAITKHLKNIFESGELPHEAEEIDAVNFESTESFQRDRKCV